MRNLKALGLALVAAFAMSAMFAVAAQAKEDGHIVSAKDTTTHETSFVTATDTTEPQPLVFTAEGENIVCDHNEFHGEIAGGTTKRLTLDTTFGGPIATQDCEAGGFPATVHNNGCHVAFYTAQTTTTSSTSGDWKVTTDLHCPAGQPGVQVTTFAGGAHGFRICTITVPPQTGLEGVTIHNKANTPSAAHDLTATIAVKGIKETESGLCGAGEANNAEMNGEVTVTAENGAEEDIDLFVEHTIP